MEAFSVESPQDLDFKVMISISKKSTYREVLRKSGRL